MVIISPILMGMTGSRQGEQRQTRGPYDMVLQREPLKSLVAWQIT